MLCYRWPDVGLYAAHYELCCHRYSGYSRFAFQNFCHSFFRHLIFFKPPIVLPASSSHISSQVLSIYCTPGPHAMIAQYADSRDFLFEHSEVLDSPLLTIDIYYFLLVFSRCCFVFAVRHLGHSGRWLF